MLSVVIEASKKFVPLYTFCKLIVWYTATGLLKSPCSHTRWDFPRANSPDRHSEFTWSLLVYSIRNKEVKFYEFTLWGQDLVSVVRIRESPYFRGSFLKKIYENVVRTLEIVRNIEVSVLEKCPYREVQL